MRRIIIYILALAVLFSCQERLVTDSADEPQKMTTVTLNLGCVDPGVKSNSPQIPDVENLIHDVWVIQYSDRGVLINQKFYRVGDAGLRNVSLAVDVIAVRSTICVITNLNKINTSTTTFFDIPSLQANLPDNLDTYRNTLLDVEHLIKCMNSNVKVQAVPQFGYWEGDLTSSSTSINIVLGRMLSRFNLNIRNIANDNASDDAGRKLTRVTFVNAPVKAYYFPRLNSGYLPDEAYCTDPEMLETTMSLPESHTADLYFYWAPNFCASSDRAMKMIFTNAAGEQYSCYLTDGPSGEDRDWKTYHNCNYTISVRIQ